MARTHKAALDDVLERFRYAEQARRGIEDVWLRNYRQYRGIDASLEARRKHNRSAVFIPKTFEKVETLTPRLVRSLLSERPWVKVYPRRGDYARAASMQALLDYQFGTKQRFIQTTADVVRNALIYGIAPAQVGWRVIARDVRGRSIVIEASYDPEQGERAVVRLGDVETRKLIAYRGPWVVALDPFGFYWDPFAASLDDADFVVVQTFRSNRWLRERADEGVYRNVNAALSGSMPENLPAWLEERRQITGWSDTWRKDLHEVLELWTNDRVTVIVDRMTVVRDEPSPFWHGELPFAVATDTKLPNEFAGLGMVLPMADLQEEYNAKRNQRLDNVNLVINKMFKVLRGADIDENELISRPGGIVHVDGPDDVQELAFGDVTASAYNEERIIDDDIQGTTGVYDYMAGAVPQRRETATGIVSLQSASDERFRLKVWQLAEDYLVPVWRQAAALNQQFLTSAEVIQVLGPEGVPLAVPVRPEDVAGDFEFVFDGSTIDTVADRQFKLNQLIQLFGLVNQVQGIDHAEYIRTILRLAEVPGIPSIVPPVPVQAVPAVPIQAQPSIPAPPNESLPGIGMTARIGPTPMETPSVTG